MILEETYDLLKSRFSINFEDLVISDVRIGLYLTAVRLSDNTIGTSATIAEEIPFCSKGDRDFGEFTPFRIKGSKVRDLMETSKVSNTISSLRITALNAVSSKIIRHGNYKIVENCDPIQLLDLSTRKTITIVGAFQSYIRKISETKNKLSVLELSENAMAPEQRKFFVPAEEYKKIIPGSDIVIITGQTLVNKTSDDLLSAVSPDTKVVVTGPSCGILPEILFNRKVNIIGTIRISKPDILFDIVGEGGTGFHLFEYCASKICILKNDE